MPLAERLKAALGGDALGGIVLMAAAALAMAFANSGGHPLYESFLETSLSVQAGTFRLAKPLHHWVNDGLMAVFFLKVGLEIKNEVRDGQLSSLDRAALPLIAALGGMLVPALAYVAATGGAADTLSGWAIPTATDIAFALGILGLAGKAAPPSLRIFLLALAIMDDLGAIVIIALFYTAQLSSTALILAAIALGVLVALNRAGVTVLAPYVVAGVLLWGCVLQSGVHATLAGVALGFAIPMSRLKQLEHGLAPWVTFGILPLFAFANAGVSLGGAGLAHALGDPVTWGVTAGLVLGKPAGVLAASFAAVRLGLGRLPEGAGLRPFCGVAALTGIGFTMSLFLGTLAFEGIEHDAAIRVGVLGGSLVSTAMGLALLRQYSVR